MAMSSPTLIASKPKVENSVKSNKTSSPASLLQQLNADATAATKEIIQFSAKIFKKISPYPSNEANIEITATASKASELEQNEAKQRKEKADEECEKSVRSMRHTLWSNAHNEAEGLLFMKNVQKYALESTNHYKLSTVLPPKRAHFGSRMTLVLDLDETLVHCSIDTVQNCDFVLPMIFNGQKYKVYARIRPNFKRFLRIVSNLFEVVLFTASQQTYADKLLNLVDPERKLIHYRLYRQHCLNVDGMLVKDLRVLGRELKHTMIIDNSPAAFAHQIENGIPIKSWYDNKYDVELMKVIPILRQLMTVDDVRPHIQKYFKMSKLLKSFGNV